MRIWSSTTVPNVPKAAKERAGCKRLQKSRLKLVDVQFGSGFFRLGDAFFKGSTFCCTHFLLVPLL